MTVISKKERRESGFVYFTMISKTKSVLISSPFIVLSIKRVSSFNVYVLLNDSQQGIDSLVLINLYSANEPPS